MIDVTWEELCMDVTDYINKQGKIEVSGEELKHIDEQVKSKQITLDLFKHSPIHLIFVLNRVLKTAATLYKTDQKFQVECIIKHKKWCKSINYTLTPDPTYAQPLNFYLKYDKTTSCTWNGLFWRFAKCVSPPTVEDKIEIYMLLLFEVSRRIDEKDIFNKIPIIVCIPYISQNFIECKQYITTKTVPYDGKYVAYTPSLFRNTIYCWKNSSDEEERHNKEIEERMSKAKDLFLKKLHGSFDLNNISKEIYFNETIRKLEFSITSNMISITIHISCFGKDIKFRSKFPVDQKFIQNFKQNEYQTKYSLLYDVALDDYNSINSKYSNIVIKGPNENLDRYLFNATKIAILIANSKLENLSLMETYAEMFYQEILEEILHVTVNVCVFHEQRFGEYILVFPPDCFTYQEILSISNQCSDASYQNFANKDIRSIDEVLSYLKGKIDASEHSNKNNIHFGISMQRTTDGVIKDHQGICDKYPIDYIEGDFENIDPKDVTFDKFVKEHKLVNVNSDIQIKKKDRYNSVLLELSKFAFDEFMEKVAIAIKKGKEVIIKDHGESFCNIFEIAKAINSKAIMIYLPISYPN